MGNLTHTVSGDIASFRSAARVPIESLKCHFLPIQEGTGDPSPDNIRPISGWNNIITYKARKNLAHIVGWSALTVNSTNATRTLSNTYGTTINTVDFIGETGTLDIIQSQTTRPEQINHYGNGYFIAVLDNLKFEKTYTVSFKISNIINNPLEASLSDLSIGNPYGNRYYTSQIINDRVIFHDYIFKQNTDKPERSYIDIRNCGMSFTISEFMVTEEAILNQEWEPYQGDIIPITFPTTGKNILNPADIIFYNNAFELDNGVYKNTATDTRSTIQLAVQLWKTTGTYIKTAYTLSYVVVGRNTITFTVDDPNCHYLCFKHNGIKKDFILLFPLPLGLRQYTISCDVLSNDPTTIGGAQITNIQLEVGDTTTTYEAYHNDVDNTVYGGYVDLITGNIVAEWVSKTALWGNIKSNNPDTTTEIDSGYIYFEDPILYVTGGANSTNSFCNIGKYVWAGKDYSTPHFYPGTRGGRTCGEIYLPYNTDDNTVIQTVLKLANSKIIGYLSPNELKTFLNYNNIWSNTNDITEVSYQIHDSNMIQQAKKNMMAENQMHYRKVLWNQWLPPLNADNWQAYSSNYTTATFNDEIATNTWISEAAGYSSSIRNKTGTLQYDGQTWYASYMLNTSTADLQWGIEMCGGRQIRGIITSPANTWIQCSAVTTYYRGTRNYTYICNLSSSGITHTGLVAQIKAPILINLTAMFGPGNEPTKEEFEYLCKINNVDLTEYHEYDEGTEQIWYIPDHNKNNYITINWNQWCKPLTIDNYKPQHATYSTITVENNIITRTIIEDITAVYQSSVVLKGYYVDWYLSHKYYFKQELKPTRADNAFIVIMRSNWTKSTLLPANQWSILEHISSPEDDQTSGQVYLAYDGKKEVIGDQCDIRNPILIDLTQMFGAGNEPSTVEELRAMCLKNNINLDEAQPYNTGTKMIWKV